MFICKFIDTNVQCFYSVVLGILATLMVVGTLVDVYQQVRCEITSVSLKNRYLMISKFYMWDLCNIRIILPQQVSPFSKYLAKEEPKPDGALVNILKCFSININGRAVLNTDSPGEGHLTCMNGLRYSEIFNGFRIKI